MSRNLYAEPLRVYLLLGLLGLAGIVAGLNLPISLFPNSSKPRIGVDLDFGSMTAPEFTQSYGTEFEGALRAISVKDARIETLQVTYDNGGASYQVFFDWGSDPDSAKREVNNVVSAWSARFPTEIRDSVHVWVGNRNAGFYAASFYSDKRGMTEVYDLLGAALKAKLSGVADADQPQIFNPDRKEVRVELRPEAMANLQLVPRDVERAVETLMASYRGGSVTVGTNRLAIQLPRAVGKPEDLLAAPIATPSGQVVHLGDVAKVDLAVKASDASLMKTSGAPSVLVFARPRSGGNVKKMAEDIQALIDEAMKTLPKDLHYRVLVDPSQFIRSAVDNVFHEVALGALLAVSVLFIFIGSLKNVVTAAIEIPLSIVLAFIMMKIVGVNINLISLGGLALSAGMNVDGSVVVMENIFRHFAEQEGRVLGRMDKLRIITQAVHEVRLPLIASTIASLVVFLPLTFTSALSYAILGDLAKAVVFSHGFSAVVALILVPTVRLQLMSGRKEQGPIRAHHSFFEPVLGRVDGAYARALAWFIARRTVKWLSYLGLAAALAALVVLVLPKLPREVIGTPDSDMIFVNMDTSGNTLVKQMETQSDETERALFAEFGDKIDYTYTEIGDPNSAWIIARLKDKKDMATLWPAMEKRFTDTPTLKFAVEPWNPSELPIPDPPDLRVAIRGGDLRTRRDVALEIKDLLETEQVFNRAFMEPNVERKNGLTLAADPEQWAALAKGGGRFTAGDLADVSRVATVGRRIGHMTIGGQDTDVMLRYPQGAVRSPEDLSALPVGVNGKIVPLRALLPFRLEEAAPPVYREDLQDMYLVIGRQNKSEKSGGRAAVARATKLIADWQKRHDDKVAASLAAGGAGAGVEAQPVVAIEDAGKDVTQAIHQLGLAIALSIVLIFVVLLLQFGSVIEALLVLVAVPLGFIGVIVALSLGHSTLSLNSALGVILLNGIAVNNSIIMVDFIRRLAAEGRTPRAAAIEAARKRLRPILITSLTTILGMLPIALGFGEGGRILQPLGIAVSGGLWISMTLTLFLVPALQVSYLEWEGRRRRRAAEPKPPSARLATLAEGGT